MINWNLHSFQLLDLIQVLDSIILGPLCLWQCFQTCGAVITDLLPGAPFLFLKNCIRQVLWEASRAPLELSEKAKRQFITMFELELEFLDCSTYSNDDRADCIG